MMGYVLLRTKPTTPMCDVAWAYSHTAYRRLRPEVL